MADSEDFFVKLNDIMNTPDESISDYTIRMTATTSRCARILSRFGLAVELLQESPMELPFYLIGIFIGRKTKSKVVKLTSPRRYATIVNRHTLNGARSYLPQKASFIFEYLMS